MALLLVAAVGFRAAVVRAAAVRAAVGFRAAAGVCAAAVAAVGDRHQLELAIELPHRNGVVLC